MTTDRPPAAPAAHAPALLPPGGTPAPPDVQPSVTIVPVTAHVVAGTATTVTVWANPGQHWVWSTLDDGWDDEPLVAYKQTAVSIDGVQVLVDHRGGGGAEALTFPTPGVHTVGAAATTTTGSVISGAPVSVRVFAAAPPAFTLTGPVNGTAVALNEAGQDITVQLSTTGNQYFPLDVAVTVDGRTTSGRMDSAGLQCQIPVHLDPMPLGARTLSVTVSDPDGQASTQTVAVTGHDAAAPHLTVDFPQPAANLVGDANAAVTVAMHGTALDAQSGMSGGAAKVEWALTAGGARTAAVPSAGTDFSSWTANVPLSGFGAHTLFVWATDNAGNTTSKDIQVDVISSYVPATLDERLSEREYLAALLSFAQEQISVPGPPVTPLDTATLVAALGQPLDRLSQPLSATADRGGREVNQLRVPVELLRARIAATATPTTPAGAALAAGYRDTVYVTLLAAAGTSYAELRLARGADAATRQALAARLGIRLTGPAPDQLDQLLLDGPALTETALETLFGLPSTTAADPLRAPAAPLLLTWRLAAQSLAWAEQDQHPSPPRAFGVLADPDVIGAADLAPGPNGDRVRTLLTGRAQTLSAFTASLTAARTGKSAAAGLAAMIALALPAGVDLAALAAKDAQGTDIGADLAVAGLTRRGFLYLRRLGALADTGTVTASEWDDGAAVLTGAFKRRVQYPAWRTAESAVVLSPDFFVPGGAAPAVSPYRVDDRARADWQSLLEVRTAQRQDLVDAGARMVADAEQAALPVLRDALLTDLAATTTGDVGEAMSARFFVDVLAGGTLRTTRTGQAIESVQSLLSAKRSGEVSSDHPAAGWSLKNGVDTFNAAWAWMGGYGTWQAATTAFLFPERNLDPALLVPGAATPTALDTLFAAVTAPGTTFTATTAAAQAAAYLAVKKVTLPAPYTTYLDPQRRDDHQAKLAAQSAAREAVDHADNREVYWAVPMLLAQRLQAAGDYRAALDWYWIVYPYDRAAPVSVYSRINSETLTAPDLTFPPGWTAGLNPFTLAESAAAHRPAPYTRYTLLSIIRCHLDYADAEFTRETDESVAHARTLYVTARRLLGAAALVPRQPVNFGEPALAVPESQTLRARAEMQLAKLRQGRNIAGMPRTRGTGAATVVQPTPYRFKTLLERARQLAAQAAQMEAGYLAALEKYDDRTLRVYDALKAIDLTAAQATVAAGRVGEANDAVTAAAAQQTKADTMARSYADAIAAPPNRYESDLLGEYDDMRDAKNRISDANAAIGVMQAASAAASITSEIFSGGAVAALSAGIALATGTRDWFEHSQNKLEAQMQANQLRAGIEQRKDEWRLQLVSAQQDSLVAAAQVATARDQVTVAVQEEVVASLSHDQARDTLTFLSGQFTNADLYLWMSDTLGGVYRYFLQQATATARLAQAQLAFERAEPARALIRQDYGQAPAEMTANAAPDRHGLTGAEQLTEDLTRLDEYAFSSARRRLNLSQTFSLARLMPVEFLEFRRTGTLAFATPMSLFDADFPGHYLRLIRQVRISLVALVPPDRGIRATLFSNGISRVTTAADGTFQDVVVRSDPGFVALTSPVNAGGVFELDAQPDMLLPFESSGVDTTWEFQLPPAANPFDFGGIVDLLVTIDYTAAHDDTYRGRLVDRLNADRGRGADCAFSLARDFPDQWYDLNNPADPADRSVTIPLRDIDLPLGIEDMTTAAVAVQLSGAGPVPPTVVTLTRGAAGGPATTTDGIASTRRGNASAWVPLCGTGPSGDWRLSFGPEAAALFTEQVLDDVVFVVSWTGQGPAWTP